MEQKQSVVNSRSVIHSRTNQARSTIKSYNFTNNPNRHTNSINRLMAIKQRLIENREKSR